MLLWKLDLGGTLTMCNCAVWPALVLLASIPDVHEAIPVVLMFLFALPFAWLFMLPELDSRPTNFDVISTCVIIGLNSFAWGYGLAAILRQWCRKPRTV